MYAQRRLWLFVLFAPAVLGSVVMLGPMALLGLVVLLPGLSGLAGLTGLLLAWLGLAWPGIIRRRRGLTFALLLMGLPATLMGVSALGVVPKGFERHQMGFYETLGPASVGFGLLSAFFMVTLCVERHASRPGGEPENRIPVWMGVAATLLGLAGTVVPAVCLRANVG